VSQRKSAFRVGRVQAYLRGQVWYLCYHENGVRRRPRVGPDRDAARQTAAEINAQLESGAPAALSFEPVALAELRAAWLTHHEQVLRSSVHTVNRYRGATEHLLRFEREVRPVRSVDRFRAAQAAEFVGWLRTVAVAPNGHPNTAKRRLMDKGVKFIVGACRSLFAFATRRRHLPPYSENPFSTLQVDRMPVEDSKPIILFEPEQERAFLEACDDWQFPMFLTLMLTGMRPGELTHLLLPDDLNLNGAALRIRNRPQLGWQVKTRNEREIPLHPTLVEVLRRTLAGRTTGPVFRRRRFSMGVEPELSGRTPEMLVPELARRASEREREIGSSLSRAERLGVAKTVWRDAGAIKPERLRLEFMELTAAIGLPRSTAPKLLRHLFATGLQEAGVDPLIRNELMGHVPAGSKGGGELAMTAVYTHTRPETKRRQLDLALSERVATKVARERLDRKFAVDDSGST